MMAHESILEAFVNLGIYLKDFCENHKTDESGTYADIEHIILKAGQQNGWFTRENVLFSLEQWSRELTHQNLTEWLSRYNLEEEQEPKTIGIVMAGNIPLVGFHDFLCVLLSGNNVLAKLSSNDTVLLPFFAEYLIKQEPGLNHCMKFTEGTFETYDAVIATGSNNTSRYFEYYFGKKPNIIRKNRNAVAVLTGKETKEQLQRLGEDVFKYYGLGCRNVSKLYVPEGYDFDEFFKVIFNFQEIIHQHKYANNYDYNKAVYLMSEFKILDNGFLVLKEDKSLSSPIASLFYEYYDSIPKLKEQLELQKDDIQCVVSKGLLSNEVDFGETQKPKLNDYADGVDTLEFLLQL
ncbi:acyl-CoA reductase [uncultured Allomuricauda sp.]|uniref:acyl-CoA reductase n=1 Tax=Flagellimonas sp. 389 TaxID=2835862 RepID=UPI0028BF10FE|nr:acyl-CoA reductase [uncultured Allomuricauda sp.]